MTKEQFEQYIAGKQLKAIYSPKITFDLTGRAKKLIGEEVMVCRNLEYSLITSKQYYGQYRFDVIGESIGWVPEEDLTELEIIHSDVKVTIELCLPQYIYNIYYDNEDSIVANFGEQCKGQSELTVERIFNSEMTEYVKSLSEKKYKPKSISLWKWFGKYEEKPNFVEIK